MKKRERIVWISVVSLFLFLSLFIIFTKEVRASNTDIDNKYIVKFLQVLKIVEKDYVDENIDNEKLINGAIKGMLEALDEIRKLECKGNDRESSELDNMLLLAKITIFCALRRKESRGTQFFSDYPERDDVNWKKHLSVDKSIL